MRLLAVAVLATLIPAGSLAAPAALDVETLLNASARHYPTILRSLALQNEAQARTLEVEGAFDLVFEAESYQRATGFYDGIAIDGAVRQRLGSLGASVYAGYKISNGTFPIYEDIRFTNTGGAFKVGALFSLLRDRDIDEDRFNRTDASLNLREAELNVLLTRIGVQQRALLAYWQWVTIGYQLRVYKNLLRIAEERETGLEEQVRQGALARIFLTENAQNITRRQTLVTLAERDLALAANSLSLFYRDDNGAPLTPVEVQLPPGVQIREIDTMPVNETVALTDALQTRPELDLLKTAIERESNRLALQENALKPRLDLAIEVQEGGLGAIAEGGPSRDTTDTVVGLTFSVPLQRRDARGKIDQSRAKLDAKRAEQQLREEQIRVEVRNLIVDLRISRELLSLAALEVRQSELLRASERRRFESGASDFFLVNLREEAAADARIKLLDAEFRTRLARANLDAATVNLERLGL
ncbi:MAG: TolC family protein [Pseudomonadota bacterium]